MCDPLSPSLVGRGFTTGRLLPASPCERLLSVWSKPGSEVGKIAVFLVCFDSCCTSSDGVNSTDGAASREHCARGEVKVVCSRSGTQNWDFGLCSSVLEPPMYFYPASLHVRLIITSRWHRSEEATPWLNRISRLHCGANSSQSINKH